MKKLSYWLFVWIILTGIISCKSPSKEELIVFHAGSLTVPVKELAKEFERENPNVTIHTEAGGSLLSIRKITDLHRRCDLLLVADYTQIKAMMYPDYAEWCIVFATNQMSIVYSPNSKYANEINAGNWHRILLQPDVRFGRSEPAHDPCGYRTLLLFKLAEEYYRIAGFYDRMVAKDRQYIRPKETDLLPLLQSGEIDYIFIYRSNGIQNRLNILDLPDSIHLGNPLLSNHYRQFSVTVTGKPTDTLAFTGTPIAYGLTIPKSSKNPELAEKFYRFLLSKPDFWEEMGQPLLEPLLLINY